MNDGKSLSAADRLRVEAAIDGELDASHALAFERDLATDPNLRALYERHAAVREAVRQAAPRELAPASLRQRIEDMSRIESATRTKTIGRRRPPPMRAPLAMAASLIAAFAAGALAGGFWPSSGASDARLGALVAGYMRGEISGQPFDVASSDRHTVKPWLTAHAPFGAEVVDLTQQGFALVGGRVDIVEKRAMPTLVYRRREHVIALTELPLDLGEASGEAALQGYHVQRWRDAERAYVAISDIDPAELAAFAAAFRDAAKSTTR